MISRGEFWKSSTRGGAKQEGSRSGEDGGKIERKSSEVNMNIRAVSRGENELIGEFKMEYTYIPTGIKRKLVRSGVDCDWKG